MRFSRVLDRKARVAGSLVRHLATVTRKEGAGAATRYAIGLLRGPLQHRPSHAGAPRSNPIDDLYGTDTAATADLHSLDIRSPNYRYAVYYQPTDLTVLGDVLGRLPIRHEDYTFIDYGAGKGLALLLAAGYPFKKVIGVEFARELYEAALGNVARYPAARRRAEIELVHQDAVQFTPPHGNVVLYLYEPFEAPVTRQVIDRVEGFAPGRDVLVAYVWSKNPILSCKPLWDAATFLTCIADGDCWTVYRRKSDIPESALVRS